MVTTRQLRVIGGKWRGRRFRFTAQATIRPTSDRIRETVFNWLSQDIYQANCLDCFSGSGALGIEALSRGASFVDFLDISKEALITIKKNLTNFGASNKAYQCTQADLNQGLPNNLTKQYQIIFLDPPFNTDLLNKSIIALQQKNILTPDTKIYIETDKSFHTELPENWQSLKEKTAGNVRYHLFKS